MRLRSFLKSCDGVSAVEFALAAPVLALVLMGIVSGWTSAVDVSDMKDSVRAGAAYILKGGLDPDAAKSVAKDSWRNMPKDATVDVVKQCTCGGGAASCDTLCTADSSIPQMSYVITAKRTLQPPLLALLQTSVKVSKQESIRVR